jgi:hypothetical protein
VQIDFSHYIFLKAHHIKEKIHRDVKLKSAIQLFVLSKNAHKFHQNQELQRKDLIESFYTDD